MAKRQISSEISRLQIRQIKMQLKYSVLQYVNHWCKHLTAVSDCRLMGAHAHILLPIELHKKTFL